MTGSIHVAAAMGRRRAGPAIFANLVDFRCPLPIGSIPAQSVWPS